MKTNYSPGLHILGTFSADLSSLSDINSCKSFFDNLIVELGLNKVGEVYHPFETGGFTAVVCLTESHVSIHTWPEFGLATFDVFLSNFTNDNSHKAQSFYSRTLSFFDGKQISHNEIVR